MSLANSFLCSASALGEIMTEQRGKTRAEKLAELSETLAKIKMQIQEAELKRKPAAEKTKAHLALEARWEKLNETWFEIHESPDVPELSQTAKTHCENWLKQTIYERRKQWETKETRKGNSVEDEAIEYATVQLGFDFLTAKNTESRKGTHFRGTTDIYLGDKVADTKCSFDCFTFPLFETDIPEKGYWWQLQAYMELWNVKKAILIYCLMDTPDDIIEKEMRWKLPENNTFEERHAFRGSYIYSGKDGYPQIPDELRIKTFEVDYDPEAIEKAKARVEQCRAYIQSLLNQLPKKVNGYY